MIRAWMLCKKPDTWNGVRGPIGAIHLTLRRLGWTWKTPFVFGNDLREDIDVTSMAPRMVKWHIEQTHNRQVKQKYSQRMLEAEKPTCIRNECSHWYTTTPNISLEEWQGCTMQEYVDRKEWYSKHRIDTSVNKQQACEEC